MDIKIYEVSNKYIDYLSEFAPHLFKNKQPGQHNERKYIGVILEVNGLCYFAPLSSHKKKHEKMKERLDFLKIGRYSVINLNNMFPIPEGEAYYVDFSKVADVHYKALLLAEYRIIRKRADKIKKNAFELYKHKTEKGFSTALAKRCNDFLLLEVACNNYKDIP